MAGETATDDEKLEQAGFAESFAPVTAPETPVAAPVGEVTAEPAPVVETPAVEPAPEYVQITKDQLTRLMAAADKTDTIDGQFSKVFGTMGSLKQHVDKLQATTPAGVSVELTDDDFAGLAADFPELAGHTRASFEKVFKKLNLRGTAPEAAPAPVTATPAAIDPDAVNKLVDEALTKKEFGTLTKSYPTWRATVGTHGDGGNPFRQWLRTQPADYQKDINESQSPAEVREALDRFTAAQKAAARPTPQPRPQTPAARNAIRRDRIGAAVQPAGDGSMPPPGKTEQDAFREGFRGS